MNFGNDRPIAGINEDRFGRKLISETLANQIKYSELNDSFVVGLIGPWGSGKTSTLNLLEECLKNKDIIIVKFNPWYFSGTQQLLEYFFKELNRELRRNPDGLKDLGKKLSKYCDILTPVKYVPVWGQLVEQLLDVFKKLGDLISGTETTNDLNGSKDAIKLELLKLKKRIVIFIDDLDRLEPIEVKEILRLVRLVGDFPGLTYVLAYDSIQIEKSLNSLNIDGRGYVEKIVQVICHVPELRERDLSQYLASEILTILNELKIEYEHNELVDVFNLGFKSLFKTPRDVKRFLNGLKPTLLQLHEEINTVDLIGAEAIRILCPDVFSLLPSATELLTNTTSLYGSYHDDFKKKEFERIWDSILKVSGEKAEAIKDLLSQLFPASQKISRNTGYGSEWLKQWGANKKIAHPDILNYYLERSLPEGVLPFKFIKSIFDNLSKLDILTSLVEKLDGSTFEHLCQRLITFEDKFTPEMVKPACIVFYQNAEKLRQEKKGFMDFGAEIEVSRLVLRLFKKLPDDQKLEIGKSLLDSDIKLTWKLDLVETVGHIKGVGSKVVTLEEATQLENKLKSIIVDFSNIELAKERDLLKLLFFLDKFPEGKKRKEEFLKDITVFPKYLSQCLSETRSQQMGKAAIKVTEKLFWKSMNDFVGSDLLKQNIDLLESKITTLNDKELRAYLLAKRYLTGELIEKPMHEEDDSFD